MIANSKLGDSVVTLGLPIIRRIRMILVMTVIIILMIIMMVLVIVIMIRLG